MYRKKSRINCKSNTMGLNSLMDVMTCMVGILLFVVLLAVFEVRAVSVPMVTPLVHDPPEGSTRILVLCQKGRVRIFDVDAVIDASLGGFEEITFDNVPEVVVEANRLVRPDHFFRYEFDANEIVSQGEVRRVITLQVYEREGALGDDEQAVAEGSSQYEWFLEEYDPNEVWLAFGVDEESVKLFHQVRAVAMQRGFAVGWDPLNIKFPYKEVILGDEILVYSEDQPKPGLTLQQ